MALSVNSLRRSDTSGVGGEADMLWTWRDRAITPRADLGRRYAPRRASKVIWREQKIQVRRVSSCGTNDSHAVTRLHLLVSINKKVIEILNANQAEPRILHVRNSVECNC